MILLNRIQEKNTKFLATMVIVIISAMMVTYGLSSLLGSYFNTDVESAYMGVQLNVMITIIVIAIITVVMLIMLPKQTVDELFRDINGNNGHNGARSTLGMNDNNNGGSDTDYNNDYDYDSRTSEQQLQDIVDEDLSYMDKK